MRRLALALLAATLLHAAGASAGIVNGTVRASSGGALPGMTVQAWTLEGTLASQTASGASGYYSLSLPPATYRLLAFDPEGVWATEFYRGQESFETSTTLLLAECVALTGVDFTLPLAGRIEGTVRDSTGAPLAGVVAAAYNLGGTLRTSAATDGAGRYRLTLPPGTYRVLVYDNARRWATAMWRATTDFEEAEVVAVAAGSTTSGIDVALVRAGVLAGTVRSTRGGAPLAGIEVQVFGVAGKRLARATTRGDGTFLVAVPAGDVKVVAYDPAQAFRTVFYPGASSFATAAAIAARADETLSGVDFALPPASSATPVELFVTGAASSPGVGGTYFRTDLWVLNVSSETAHLSITFLPSGADGSAEVPVGREVAPGAQLAVADAVATLFGRGGGGALRIVSDVPVLASSRTWTPAPGGGSYGLGIPAVSAARAIVSGRLPALRVDAAYRTNVAFVNPGSAPLAIALVLSDASGATLATGSVSLPPLGHFQASTIASHLGVGSVSSATLRMTAPAPFFAYATVIDQVTGDATFLAADAD